MVMAPLTRFRANADHTPGPYAKTYYEQRSCVPGTLIVTEATFIAPRAGGYNNIPGIWNDEQISGWKEIVDTIHAKGCYVWLQLWALGRVAGEGRGPQNLAKHGYEVMSSSSVAISPDHREPKAMTKDDIQRAISDYANAAENAITAGFDGVEIHGESSEVQTMISPC